MTFVEEIREHIHRISAAVGIDPQRAQQIADRVVGELAAEHGGERVYVANGLDRAELEERDAAIRRDRAAGMTLRKLGRKWMLSHMQVRRIVTPPDSRGLQRQG